MNDSILLQDAIDAINQNPQSLADLSADQLQEMVNQIRYLNDVLLPLVQIAASRLDLIGLYPISTKTKAAE